MTRIDIAEVTHFAHQLRSSNQEARTGIAAVKRAVENYINDRSITGEAITTSKEYYAATYFPLCNSIKQGLNLSEDLLQKYITDFHSQVDASPNARLDADGIYDLGQKMNTYENKMEDITAQLSHLTDAKNVFELNGLTAQIFEAHKKEQILEKLLDFERSHARFFDELGDLAHHIQVAIQQIKQNLRFDSRTGSYHLDTLSAEPFADLVRMYASQQAIDDKIKAMEEIGLTPNIPKGNQAGFVLTDGILNTEATLDLANQQIIYWQNESTMRELFGVGALYRAVYGIDAVTAERISNSRRAIDGVSVVTMYAGSLFGVSKFVDTIDLLPMYRKTANTGAFSGLSEPMQLRHVEQVAKDAGIGLEGIKIKIIRDTDLVNREFYGRAVPKGNSIELYPRAFTDKENLIMTLGHERMHVYQIKTFGAPDNSRMLGLYEKGAELSEPEWLNYYYTNNSVKTNDFFKVGK
ncbi:hypothetical protein PWEIH_11355 [Listeria weihenstephanensis FSL R9-0317]|uniref:T7SS effector LXG polymorphic toxin n=1 Tax=Listeria weihenstephanensis TaxID=1006155 RepID=UPI0003E85BD7|nr:T7SS effector LXG polymorphic toxin [Listeria weihenstephanensis]EUJ36756.1 hypothetical protein PWEIH_11355 [Listeria weihenstephanensis FSL R9-0317]